MGDRSTEVTKGWNYVLSALNAVKNREVSDQTVCHVSKRFFYNLLVSPEVPRHWLFLCFSSQRFVSSLTAVKSVSW